MHEGEGRTGITRYGVVPSAGGASLAVLLVAIAAGSPTALAAPTVVTLVGTEGTNTLENVFEMAFSGVRFNASNFVGAGATLHHVRALGEDTKQSLLRFLGLTLTNKCTRPPPLGRREEGRLPCSWS